MDMNDSDPKPAMESRMSAPPKASSGVGWIIAAVLLAVLVGGACVCTPIMVALLLPAVQAARDAARTLESTNNLKQIGLALHSYELTHGTLPPAYIADENGRPMTSWRTLILPHLEQQNLYDTIDFTKSWDDPANAVAGDIAISTYHSPRDGTSDARFTNYLAITGEGTMMPGAEAMSFSDANDGLSNTILVVEVLNSDVPWNEPRDLDVGSIRRVDDGADPRSANVMPRRGVVLFGDGSVRKLNGNVSREMLDAYFTRSGGELTQSWPSE